VQRITEETDRVRRDLELLKPQTELIESEAEMRKKYDALLLKIEKQRKMFNDENECQKNQIQELRLLELESQLQQATESADFAAVNFSIIEQMLSEEMESRQRTELELADKNILADRLERELEEVKMEHQLKQEVVRATQIRQLEDMSKKSDEVKELLMRLMANSSNPQSSAHSVSATGINIKLAFYLCLMCWPLT